MIKDSTAKDINESLSSRAVTVLLFSLPTCSRCKFMAGVLNESLQKAGLSDVDILKIDCSRDVEVAKEYGVTTVPTIVVSHNGESSMHYGKVDIKNITEIIRGHLHK